MADFWSMISSHGGLSMEIMVLPCFMSSGAGVCLWTLVFLFGCFFTFSTADFRGFIVVELCQ